MSGLKLHIELEATWTEEMSEEERQEISSSEQSMKEILLSHRDELEDRILRDINHPTAEVDVTYTTEEVDEA